MKREVWQRLFCGAMLPLCVLLLCSACSGEQREPSPTPVPTLTPAPTPEPTPSPTPTPSQGPVLSFPSADQVAEVAWEQMELPIGKAWEGLGLPGKAEDYAFYSNYPFKNAVQFSGCTWDLNLKTRPDTALGKEKEPIVEQAIFGVPVSYGVSEQPEPSVEQIIEQLTEAYGEGMSYLNDNPLESLSDVKQLGVNGDRTPVAVQWQTDDRIIVLEGTLSVEGEIGLSLIVEYSGLHPRFPEEES